MAGDTLCPSCGKHITPEHGFREWCPSCSWNAGIEEGTSKENWLQKLYTRAGQKSAESLFAKMRNSDPTQLRQRSSGPLFLALTICALLMVTNIATAVLGIWLLVAFWPNLLAIVAGVVLLGLAWMQRPRLGSVPKNILSRGEFPRLFRLVDDVSAALGAKPIAHVVVDANFNASMSAPGWRRTPVLTLGLPLFSTLTAQQRVDLVAHEVAHSVNGDPARGTLLGIALSTLDGWIGVLMQDSREMTVGLAAMFANMMMRTAATVLMLVRYGILRLTYIDSQRAEYLADYLAARIAGTDAAVSSFEVLTAGQHISRFVASSYEAIDEHGATLIERLGRHLRSLPPGERERLRRSSLAEHAHIDATHPPNNFRVQFLNAHRIEEPAIVLTDEDSAEIDRELRQLEPDLSVRFMASELGER